MTMRTLARQTLCCLPLVAASVAAQQAPLTTPERTGFAATSTNAQVGAFLDSLQRLGAPIAVTEMGVTALGKPIYLVIASDPAVTTPAEAAAAGKLVVYLQANIHGGEVEGKEAALALLRELAGVRRSLLEQLVILVAPDYNPDGNDALGPQAVNRSEQNGPELVGQRADGMNLDLNRDYFKVEAPETRGSIARVLVPWDPAVMMDLHTTDGTQHGYLLTYAPPLDPVGPAGPTQYARDQMLPAIRKVLQERYHEPIFDYGNVDDPLAPKSWDTYAPLGWYGTNYVGLRGRIGILSEAYSHADFKTRIQVTHDFVVAVLEYAAQHAGEIRAAEQAADRLTTLEGAGLAARPPLATAYRLAGRGEEPVTLEVLRPNPDSAHGGPRFLPSGELRTYRIPVNDRFTDSLTQLLPAGYFLPPAAEPIVDVLRIHGVQVVRIAEDWADTVEVLGVTDVAWGPREFQGHHLVQVSGRYSKSVRTLPAGTYFVTTAQPLGRLVFALLEPSGYGLARWGLLDRWMGAEFGAYSGLVYGSSAVNEFPVWRAVRLPRAATRSLP
jgi:zinc carboxypeptidase